MTASLIPLAPRRSSPALQFGGYLAALVAVAVATMLGLAIVERWGSEPVVLLYIPAVLAAAIYAGLGPALVAAVASALAYNYYFTAPLRTFLITRPADVVTVIVLFIVAVVTSQLVSLLRKQAGLAVASASRNATIAGFARRLLSCADVSAIAETTVEELGKLFDCHAVFIDGEQGPAPLAAMPSGAALAPSDHAAAAVTLETGEATGRGVRKLDLADWQFRPIASGSAVIATIGLARADGVPPVDADKLALLESLLDQVALALDRARLERAARGVAALHERDQLRAALLTSIGEDVKPRLQTLGSAARALKREGASDRSLLASLTGEVAKLDRFVENLADLTSGQDQQPLVLGDVTIDFAQRLVARDGAHVHLTPKEYALLVELARNAGRVLTHAHLLRAVWGPAQTEQIDYLRVAVRALRQKLEADPAKPTLIVNEPAVGYRLVAS